MKTMKHLVIVILSLVLAACFAFTAAAQQPQAPAKAPAVEQPDKVSVKGKIAYMPSGYYLQAENPPYPYLIVNQNERVLKDLMKKGKTVSVEGHLSGGADQLVIEKIDGKKYTGK